MYYAGCGAAPTFGSMTYYDDYVVEQKPISRPKHHQRQPYKKVGHFHVTLHVASQARGEAYSHYGLTGGPLKYNISLLPLK